MKRNIHSSTALNCKPNSQTAFQNKPTEVTLWRSCEVCGEDTWCGSDGCPLDPQ